MGTKDIDLDQLSNDLYNKVNAEYTEFIEDRQK